MGSKKEELLSLSQTSKEKQNSNKLKLPYASVEKMEAKTERSVWSTKEESPMSLSQMNEKQNSKKVKGFANMEEMEPRKINAWSTKEEQPLSFSQIMLKEKQNSNKLK